MGFSDTRNYLVQYFVRMTFTGCRPSLWQTHLRTLSPGCSAMPTKRRVLRSRGSFLSLPFSFASDSTEACFVSPHRMVEETRRYQVGNDGCSPHRMLLLVLGTPAFPGWQRWMLTPSNAFRKPDVTRLAAMDARPIECF